jgi:basic amino acid/polyamine antiporter, APA family
VPATHSLPSRGPNAGTALLRVLGVGFGLAVVVGGTIGVGILRTPGIIAGLLGDPALILIAWALGGVYCLLVANSVAELAAAIPKAGGPYVFARAAYGDYGGFLVGWGDWLTNTVAMAYLPIALAEFTGRLFPALAGHVSLVACGVLLAFLALQLAGVRAGSRTQRVTSLVKGLGLLAFVAAAFLAAPARGAVVAGEGFDAPASLLSGFAAAMPLIVGTYGGWYAASYFGEEDNDPGRNLPRALLGGLATILVVYVLVNAAYLWVLPMAEFAGTTLPAAAAMQRVFGGASDRIVTALSILLLLSIVNALVMAIPRILFAMARDGLFFRRATEVNRGGTPSVATMVTVGAAMILALSGSFQQLFALTAFLLICVDINSSITLLVLRRRAPGLARPWHALGAPWTTVVALCISVLLLCGFAFSDPRTSALALAFLAASWPVFLLVRHFSRATEGTQATRG